jgi:hypothetical protein
MRALAARVLDRRVEHLEDARARRDALLQRPEHLHQAPQRRGDQQQRRQEGHEVVDRISRVNTWRIAK